MQRALGVTTSAALTGSDTRASPLARSLVAAIPRKPAMRLLHVSCCSLGARSQLWLRQHQHTTHPLLAVSLSALSKDLQATQAHFVPASTASQSLEGKARCLGSYYRQSHLTMPNALGSSGVTCKLCYPQSAAVDPHALGPARAVLGCCLLECILGGNSSASDCLMPDPISMQRLL